MSARNEQAAVSLDPFDVDIASGLIAKPVSPHARIRDRGRKLPTAKNIVEGATLHPGSVDPSVVNGTRVIPDLATAGHGELEAINGTARDAYVLVVDVRRNLQVRWILIGRGHRVSLNSLDAGDYRVVFETGLDWNDVTRKFDSNPNYYQLGGNLSFQETRSAEGIIYDHHSITLYPVQDGNIKMIHLTEAQFRELSGKQ